MPPTASPITEKRITGALRGIEAPGLGQDIVAAGMISGIVMKGGNVGFSIEIDPARQAEMEPVRKACEDAVMALDGVTSVTAVLTAERQAPGDQQAQPAADHGRGPAQGQDAQAKPQLGAIKTIIAVASGKGGVGKSTTAVNLALALSGRGLAVGLLDADIYGPSIPRMLGITGRPHSEDGKVLEPMSGYGVKCMSMGFLIDEETPMIWRGPMVQGALEQMMRDVDWGPLDVMVVDMPPGTGDAQLTMAQRVPLAGAVIVSTPQDIALLDARKGLNMFRKVDVPVLGIVENMSYFLCPHCGERSDIFSHGGARETAEQLGVPFLGEVPLDIAIRETSDGGRPIVMSDPNNPHAEAYRNIAAAITEQLAAQIATSRPAPRIVVD